MTKAAAAKGTKGSVATDAALLILRLSGFGLALAHGWPKVERLLSGESAAFVEGVAKLGFPYPTVFAWAATAAELVGGLAIALGLLTRVAAFFAAFTMAVAAFLRHHLAEQVLSFFGIRKVAEEVLESWGDPERAAIYLLIFLALVLLGGGKLSLDRLARRG
jgi:putative oxidoreductase